MKTPANGGEYALENTAGLCVMKGLAAFRPDLRLTRCRNKITTRLLSSRIV
jgi:hypothetical protein